jgi:hypothetical protein
VLMMRHPALTLMLSCSCTFSCFHAECLHLNYCTAAHQFGGWVSGFDILSLFLWASGSVFPRDSCEAEVLTSQ